MKDRLVHQVFRVGEDARRFAQGEHFHFADLLVAVNLQPQPENHGMAVLFDGSEEAHLSGLRIGEIELVVSEGDGGTPHAVAQFELLTVFGVACVFGER